MTTLRQRLTRFMGMFGLSGSSVVPNENILDSNPSFIVTKKSKLKIKP